MDSSSQHNGFTLVEILVAMVIIGIVLGVALLRLNNNDSETELKQEFGRLARMMELADQQAIFSAQEIGLLLKRDGYEFMVYDDKDKWQALDDDLLKKKKLPEQVDIKLNIDGADISLNSSANQKDIPQIIFYSSGEWTAFELEISNRYGSNTSFVLSNIKTGELELNREEF